VDLLVREQQQLTAVERFAQRHAEAMDPLQSRYYADLIPVGRQPQAGQQLAFQVDLDLCTGCKACVAACHNLNGLDADETWRDVGLALSVDSAGTAYAQHVTTTCHHCEDPACLAGCPTLAYEKDPETGIVRHLDDQCIGCQYCLLKCPYDVPKYSEALGIVRKCDMCAGRLAHGEAPACVQACPNGAIAIQIVDRTGSAAIPELLPGMNGALPDAGYTHPTTRYVTAHPERVLRPASDVLRPSAAHDPLALMLVLVQLSVGLLTVDVALWAIGSGSPDGQALRLGLAAIAAALGLGAATLHLGRPLQAFRAFLGWRTSWMSREILALGAYVPLVALTAGACTVAGLSVVPEDLRALARLALPALEAASLAFGLLGTLCSVMIYVDTRRALWTLSRTAPRFLGTAVVLGSTAAAAITASAALAALGLCAGALKVGSEVRFMRLARVARGDAPDDLARSARLLGGELTPRFQWRLRAAALAGAAGALAVGGGLLGSAPVASSAAGVAFAAAFAGELVERHLFFTAQASRAMPGH
jgi:Fe-S-cluster-containing dehydrogenase component/DMSO reductase anchor subunit